MAYDPVHAGQLYVRRAGQRLRSRGMLADPEFDKAPRELEGEARERFFATGYSQIATLAADIEAHTGAGVQGRTVLDYGCGVGRMALPMAERAERVIGLDVSPAVLEGAARNAQRMGISNVEWHLAETLAEHAGRYDMVQSVWVFQHIPSREGERIFATILAGLAPGGVGAVHFTLRPSRPLAGMFNWGRDSTRSSLTPLGLIRSVDWGYPYILMNSYSLNRLGRMLADAGVTRWYAKWHQRRSGDDGRRRPYEAATLIFRKGD